MKLLTGDGCTAELISSNPNDYRSCMDASGPPTALVVGVSKFGEGLNELPAHYARDLMTSLHALGHKAELFDNPSADELAKHLKRVTDGHFNVVHLLTHGEWDDSEHLLVAGAGASYPEVDEKWVDLREWLSKLRRRPGDSLLLLLDTCYSGKAAHFNWLDDGNRKVYVLAASAPDAPLAFAARFTRAVTKVLNRLAAGDALGAHPAVPVVSLGLVKNAVAIELDALCTSDRATPQRLVSSRHQLDDHVHPLFRNPHHRLDSWDGAWHQLAAREPALTDSVDPVMGTDHFLTRATGATPGEETSLCHFSGRRRELGHLRQWLDTDPTESSLHIVTGSPGMGKSALLGVMVCLAHPELEAFAHDVENRLDPALKPDRRLPGEIAAAHARNREVSELVASIGRQLKAPGEITQPDKLIEYLRMLPAPPTIVVDALDEADDPGDVHLRLMMPLATGHKLCRLLVGTREQARFDALFGQAAESTNLDGTDMRQLRDDVQSYVVSVLRESDWRGEIARAFADGVAATVTPTESGPVEVGPFLLAQLHTHRMLPGPGPSSTEAADTLGRWAPRSVKDAFLSQAKSGRADRWLGPMLVAFAHARGTGMPVQIARAIALRLHPELPGRSDRELTALVTEDARFYLRSDVDGEGRALFSLFHQSLQEHLTAYPWSFHPMGERTGPGAAALVYEALLDELGYSPGQRPDWANRGIPYLRRHLGRHAIAAGRFDEIAIDPEFLANAHPDQLMRDLRFTSSAEARLAASVYRSSYLYHLDAEASEDRLHQIALDSARHGADALHADVESVAGEVDGMARWSTGAYVDSGLLDVLEGHTRPVRTVECMVMEGRPVAVTGSDDKTVRVWDLSTGEQVRVLHPRVGEVRSAACAVLEGRPVVVIAGDDVGVLVCDLVTGERVRTLDFEDHVRSVSCCALDGQVVAVISGAMFTQVWNLSTWQEVAELDVDGVEEVAFAVLSGRTVAVTAGIGRACVMDLVTGEQLHLLNLYLHGLRAVACTELNGRPVAITGRDGSTQVWDVGTGHQLHALGGIPEVRAVACTDLGGRPLAVIGGSMRGAGVLQVWDISRGEQMRVLRGHLGPVNTVATALLDGRSIVVSGDHEGTVLVWDLTAEDVHGARGHVADVTALATAMVDGRHVAISGGDDKTVRVWDLATGEQLHTLPHTGPVRALACSVVDGRPIAVTGGYDETRFRSGEGWVLVWDLATGEQLHTLSHPGPVIALACSVVDGRPIAVGGCDETRFRSGEGWVLVWDLATGEQLHTLPHTGPVRALACSVVDGRPIAVTCSYRTERPGSSEMRVYVWDLATGKRLHTLPHTGAVRALACALVDGTTVAVVGTDAALLVWDLVTGEQLSSAPFGNYSGPFGLDCGVLDGKPVAVTVGSRTSVWDLRTGELLRDHDFRYLARAVVCATDSLVIGYDADVAALNYPGLDGSA